MTGYVVDTAVMRSHASKLKGIEGDVKNAADAGLTTALDAQAFGLVCSFLYPPAAAVQLTCVAGIEGLALGLAGTADAIRAIADGYDEVDDALSGTLTKLLAAIPTT